MCAWFVLSSLGIYPLTPGHPSWTLGSPLFSQAKIHLPNGKTFTVDAPHNGAERPYVAETLLNGRSHADLFVSHRDVAEGGTLTFHMSDRPKTEVVEAKHRPFSASQD
jgi:putative alpha-1,2-mannosidase